MALFTYRALTTSKGPQMHQMDVTTTFLYAPLEEEVFMEQPEGTVLPGDEGKVMWLRKCLYGLKQAPRLLGPLSLVTSVSIASTPNPHLCASSLVSVVSLESRSCFVF